MQKQQFDNIRTLLNDFVENPEAQAIYAKANFTPMQLKAINVLIVEAIRYYDAFNNGAELNIR